MTNFKFQDRHPSKGKNYDSAVHTWYDYMIHRVKHINGDALVSVNAYPDPWEPTLDGLRADFEAFFDGIDNDEVDIVSYHFPYWFRSGSHILRSHFIWHNTYIGSDFAMIIDDDGDVGDTYRQYNDNVAAWSKKCTFDNDYNFIHKDLQHFDYNLFTPELVWDEEAMYAVATGTNP